MLAVIEPLTLPNLQERSYFWTFGTGLIAVFAPGYDGPCVIAAAPDPGEALHRLRGLTGSGLLFAHGICCSGRIAAQNIVSLAIGSDLRQSRRITTRPPFLACSIESAKAAIEAAAGRLQVPLTSYSTALARCAGSVQRIEDALRANNGLQAFNRYYAARRRAAAARQRPGMGHPAVVKFMSYTTARARLIALMAEAAATGRQVKFAEVFARDD